MHPFSVTITSPNAILFEGKALSLTCPSTGGMLTILKDHEPLITTLAKGLISIKREGGELFEQEVEGGVLEVSSKGAVLLV